MAKLKAISMTAARTGTFRCPHCDAVLTSTTFWNKLTGETCRLRCRECWHEEVRPIKRQRKNV